MEETTERLEIDQGFRAWYAACPCCLQENHPEVKATLDGEARDRLRRGTNESDTDAKAGPDGR
jgi:hypothetical protein